MPKVGLNCISLEYYSSTYFPLTEMNHDEQEQVIFKVTLSKTRLTLDLKLTEGPYPDMLV